MTDHEMLEQLRLQLAEQNARLEYLLRVLEQALGELHVDQPGRTKPVTSR